MSAEPTAFKMFDVTNSDSPGLPDPDCGKRAFRQVTADPAEAKRQTDTIQPESLSVKCGNLEIRTTGTHMHNGVEILIDGQPARHVRSLSLHGAVGEAWVAKIEWFPNLKMG